MVWTAVRRVGGLVLAASLTLPAVAASLLDSSSASSPSPLVQRLSPFPNATFSTPEQDAISPFRQLALPKEPECPPCNPFNCVLPAFACLNEGECNTYNGQCICPPGFGGEDCGKPLCGSLPDGHDRYPRTGPECECAPGWTGLNCNVCETDSACKNMLPSLSGGPKGFSSLPGTAEEDEEEAVCYKEGFAVREVYSMCDVTNRKILDMLPGRPPQVTFTCDLPERTCGFQFWIGKEESFYCGLKDCAASFQPGLDSNYTEYNCEKVECACIPGRMLCGENGSVDISEFLTEEIKGPGKFSTRSGEGSKFEEPAMNELINDVFGDTFITLSCASGECMRVSDVPGFEPPPRKDNSTLLIASIAVVGVAVVVALFIFWQLGRAHQDRILFPGGIRLGGGGANGAAKNGGVADHVPASLQFSDLSYSLSHGRLILDSISGTVAPGQIMAVIGASGAGKSTFLDLLARRSKRGSVKGEIFVNGKVVPDSEYRRVVGFVDQEDTLLGTLTVYETILNSAMLRLPRDMSFEDKKMRVLETMNELGILGIRDSRVGESGKRSISGGEKRRVSIACELVTSPSILFLDEPTSGLDSFNAFNVIESLMNLARTYKRTVVFTIHQPRSNIVALFDKLVLLSSGKLVYSGDSESCQAYFESLGYSCPPGFNIADYLIDLTMQQDADEASRRARAESVLIPLEGEDDAVPVSDAEAGILRPSNGSTPAEDSDSEPSTTRNSMVGSIAMAFTRGAKSKAAFAKKNKPSAQVEQLAAKFQQSEVAKSIEEEIRRAREVGAADTSPIVLRLHKRASWWTQFTILSGRSFKNLYRNPMLMLSHYAVSVIVACICAFLFSNLTNDIPGFQNRMGLFFFILALFGFGCLTSLSVFATERLLFMRERANGYYSPFTYFSAKVLFDVLPLRVIPPFILGAIIYAPVGLVPAVDSFWRFILVLILFNMAASSAVLLLSIVVKDGGVANLVGSLIMLFNLLFAGLLINRDKLPWFLQWLETVSFFHAAFEALLVNEVRYLQLTDHRYGVDIEVPAATILSMFGFKAQAFWFPDVALLLVFFGVFTITAFVALVVLVKESR